MPFGPIHGDQFPSQDQRAPSPEDLRCFFLLALLLLGFLALRLLQLRRRRGELLLAPLLRWQGVSLPMSSSHGGTLWSLRTIARWPSASPGLRPREVGTHRALA